MADAPRPVIAVLGGAVLLALSVLYCLPGHPSTHMSGWDEAAHVALFGVVAWVGGWLLRKAWPFALMAALGVLLEVVQWHLGGYARLEIPDILANEAGVALAYLLRRKSSLSPPGRGLG
ncbi:hypothetical protein [Frateuria sp. STR12]|uniref:hypothetical protein n=1 Tax=Frateuria hangzhouensis TaxID=2995589 RepID=UPI00226103CD|nr:hypothetical protein [Frateuria sp. STR12]MCX7515323.1 hypothetical protein [Frateuria sp. STR12]